MQPVVVAVAVAVDAVAVVAVAATASLVSVGKLTVDKHQTNSNRSLLSSSRTTLSKGGSMVAVLLLLSG